MKKSILIVYGASTKLAFVDQFVKDEFGREISTDIIYFGHHKTWYSGSWYRYISNSVHMLKLILHILLLAPKSKIVIFSTNAARLLFPFLFWSNASVIFNELPVLDPKYILYRYDRLIFCKFHKVYLSSIARVELVMKSYDLERSIGLVNNIPNLTGFINYKTEQARNGFIYSGLISPGRFSVSNKKLEELAVASKMRIDFFGFKSFGYELDQRFFDHRGNVPHAEMLKILERYKFGILQYAQSDYNNEYCAPIKIYEYLSLGCIILSVNNNIGLKRLESEFPGIIYFLDDIDLSPDTMALGQLTFNKHSAQRCLKEAYRTNTEFVLDFLGDMT